MQSGQMQQQQAHRKQTKSSSVSLFKFFSFNSTQENLLILFGSLSAILAGFLLPSISYIVGGISTSFGTHASNSDDSANSLQSQVGGVAKYIIIIAFSLFILSYSFYSFWQQAAERITMKLRVLFLQSLLTQEMSFFEDELKIEELPSQIADIFGQIQKTIGFQLGNLIFSISACIGGIGFAFYRGPIFALCCLAYLPVFVLLLSTFGLVVRQSMIDRVNAVKGLGGVVAETFSAIKVVVSFGGEEIERQKMDKWIGNTEQVGKRQQIMTGIMYALMKLAIFMYYTYTFFVGSIFITDQKYNSKSGKTYDTEDIISILIAFITGFVTLVAALPNVQALTAAKISAKPLFDIIDRESSIQNSKQCQHFLRLQKAIRFQNVSFKYTKTPKEYNNVIENLSFEIRAGETTAIIGASGLGKSTIVQMIERFYDPLQGNIYFDETNVKDVDLKVLREAIGYVSQEPHLIIGTIRENLLLGNKDATERDIEEALSKSNANFVYKLEKQLDTFVGSTSMMNLSGGQKQRLAIARALIKKPKILILDEATSALDQRSEKEVQQAIDKISSEVAQKDKLTIIIIAHRLSTIQNCDNIIYFRNKGNVQHLMKGTSQYKLTLQRLQSLKTEEKLCSPKGAQLSSSSMSHYTKKEINTRITQTPISIFKKQELEIKKMQRSIQQQFHGEIEMVQIEPLSSHNLGMMSVEEEEKVQFTEEQSRENDIENSNDNFSIKKQSGKTIHKIHKRRTHNNKVYPDLNTNTNKNSTVGSSDIPITIPGFLIKSSPPSLFSSPFKQAEEGVGGSKYSKEYEINNLQKGIDPQNQKYRKIKMSEIMAKYKPKSLIILGLVSSTLVSLSLPLFGFIISRYIFVLQLGPNNSAFYTGKKNFDLAFLFLCIGICIFTFLQKLSFSIGGENLIKNFRTKLFEEIIYKHIGWFDNKHRAVGILTTIFAEDIQSLNGMSTETVSAFTEAILGCLISCLICFIFDWRLALIAMAVSPLLIAGGYFASMIQFGVDLQEDQHYQSNALLADIIINFKTVISFGDKNIKHLTQNYSNFLLQPYKNSVKQAHLTGLLFGFGQFMRFIYIAFVFYIAAVLIDTYNLNSQDVFTGIYVVFVGSIGSGASFAQAPSIAKAQKSAQKIFGIIEEKSEIDPRQKEGLFHNIPIGKVEFKNVEFKYPSRNLEVFKNLKLKMDHNQSVAIIGYSGGGKSTIAALLLRLYDTSAGEILIDGIDIKRYSVASLREQISIVLQEPLLFNDTIKNNILYGNRGASDEKVYEVAMMANCLGFIEQDEDIHNEEVKLKIEKEFEKSIQSDLKRQYPNFLQIEVAFRQRLISHAQLRICTSIFQNVNSQCLAYLELNIERFIESLMIQGQTPEISWVEVLKFFDWLEEWTLIKNYLDSYKNLKSSQRDQIMRAYETHAFQFDLETVKHYLQLSQVSQKQEEEENKFQNAIKLNKTRVVSFYEKRISEFRLINDSSRPIVLHEGFNKMCGLRGSSLSGGQKQRIAIARALIKDPKILILDEATSALDENSQHIVQQALEKALEGRTSIVIAHRLSTIKKCNKIFVLHHGEVVEEGTFEELSLIENGYLQKLKQGAEM